MQGSLTERVTRSLAYMLRHQPEEFDLDLDRYGFAELSEVVHALNERLGEPVEEDDVVQAIESGDRPRYEIEDGRIRALYGHSIPIDPGDPSEPPELLYVGVGSRDASRAERHGLEGGRRAFLHLAIDYEDARETGRRIAPRYAVVTVRAREAAESGIRFYDRKALFLSGAIPTEFLEVGEPYDDGVRREDRGGSRRPSRGRGSSRRSGSRERSDARDDYEYTDARERPEHRERSESRSSSRDRLEPRGPRREREEEPARTRPAPARDAGSKASPRSTGGSGGSGGFGLGIFHGDDAAPEREQAPEPEPRRRAEPAREPAREPVPETPQDDGGSGFGTGIF